MHFMSDKELERVLLESQFEAVRGVAAAFLSDLTRTYTGSEVAQILLSATSSMKEAHDER